MRGKAATEPAKGLSTTAIPMTPKVAAPSASSLARSAFELASGMARRAWLIVPALLLDPFDFWERYINPQLPVGWQRPIGVPAEYVPLVLGAVAAAAALSSYDDLRRRHEALVQDVASAQAAANEERTSRARRKQHAKQIRDYMKRGLMISKMVDDGSVESARIKEALDAWEQKVEGFIEANLPGYGAIFLSGGGPGAARIVGHAARTASLNRVRARLAALSTIIQKVDPDLE